MKLKNYWNVIHIELQDLYFDINKLLKGKKKFIIKFFYLYMHKKLNYFFLQLFEKFYNYSNGQLLGNQIKKIKFFKKSKKSYPYTINLLNKKLSKKLNSIDIFYCKNFNLRNYNWLKKFFTIIKPEINYMICTGSWNYINLRKKRIKKKIYRNLIKNSKLD